ncbi:MAG: HAD family phosphatase [Nitrososphaerota archaeon]|nr:HAD family phosphatase [Nitrososphaerota archaeon]
MTRDSRRLKVGVLALDFDGTIYPGDRPVSPALLRLFASVKKSGVNLVLVTGRSLAELMGLVDLSLFDAVVAENGAILMVGGKETDLSPPGWHAVRRKLLERLGGGKEEVIISLAREEEGSVKRWLGRGFEVEFNKDRLMVIPPGVDKGTGLSRAIEALAARGKPLMCIGDGENDVAMFRIADLRVAVKNSPDVLAREADYVARKSDGAGASEAIKRFISIRTSGQTSMDRGKRGDPPWLAPKVRDAHPSFQHRRRRC